MRARGTLTASFQDDSSKQTRNGSPVNRQEDEESNSRRDSESKLKETDGMGEGLRVSLLVHVGLTGGFAVR